MHGRIRKVTNELTIVVTSDDLSYTKQDAIKDADEYLLLNYPDQNWWSLDVELDKYNAWSVRYQRAERGPNESRSTGPDWGAT